MITAARKPCQHARRSTDTTISAQTEASGARRNRSPPPIRQIHLTDPTVGGFRLSESAVLEAAARAFIAGGYEGTSIDDLVKALNLHRGSLYKAFGSKRGLLLATLRHYVRARLPHLLQSASASGSSLDVLTQRRDLDLLLVAAVERGGRDAEVAALVRKALVLLERATDKRDDHARSDPPADRPAKAIALLDARLYERLHDDASGVSDRQHRPITKET